MRRCFIGGSSCSSFVRDIAVRRQVADGLDGCVSGSLFHDKLKGWSSGI